MSCNWRWKFGFCWMPSITRKMVESEYIDCQSCQWLSRNLFLAAKFPSDIPCLVPCLHPFCQVLKLGFLTQLGHGGDSSGNALVWWVHAQLEESSSAQTKQGPEGPEQPETVAIPSLNLSPQEEHEPLTTRVQANCNSNSKSNSNSLSLSRFPLWSKRDLLLQLEQNGTSVANI